MKAVIFIFSSILFSIPICFSQNLQKNESFRLKYLEEGKYDSALYYAEETAAFLRGTSGEKNPEFADALNALAVAHFYKGNFTKARYYALREVELRESIRDIKSPKYIQSLENASEICRRAGRYEESLEIIKKAEKPAAKIYGAGSKLYGGIMTCMGKIYTDMGSSLNDLVFMSYADDYFLKADKIFSEKGSEAIRARIVNTTNMASYYSNTGNSPLAESLFLQAVALCEKEYGVTDPAYAAALNNLGVFYYNGGFYKQAENYFVKASDIFKNSREAESLKDGICINNLGALYHDMGNYNTSEKLLQDARGIFDKFNYREHPYYGVLLNNLGMVNLSREYYAATGNKNRGKLLKCGQILFLADSIFERNVKLPNPAGYSIRNNLSLWYKMTGDSKKSLQMITDQAYESNMSMKPISMISKMSLPGKIPSSEGNNASDELEMVMIPIRATMTDNMIDEDVLRQNSNDQSASTRLIINLFVGKAEKVKQALGPFHPGYASLVKSLIPLYSSIGSLATEEELTLEYIGILNHNIIQDFSFLSDSEKELYFQTRKPAMDDFMAYTLKRKETNPKITCNAYDFVIQNKGLMLKSSTAMRQAILSGNDTSLLRKYDSWLSLQKEISALYATPVEMRVKDVKILEADANQLEKELVRNSQTFGEYRKGIQATWNSVRSSLNPSEAAIEFTNFKVKERDLGDMVYYCALIIRNDSPYPEMVKLFEEKELTAILGEAQENNSTYINRIYGTRNQPANALYKLIWQPLEAYLRGVKKVYVSPAGLLYKVSFAALGSEKDVYLCDKYNIQVKGSTGNTVMEDQLPSGNNLSALVFGGIKYSEGNSGPQVWDYLKGTKDEGDAVTGILKKGEVQVRYLTDNSATETFLKKNVRDYNLLHVATHGFFFPDPNQGKFEEKGQEVEVGAVTFRGAMRGFGVNSFVNNLNPLMRSGLVMAGANDVWNKSAPESEDDGVLTAQEVTQIDMRKNMLVVLSACETGLGDIKGTEGVYGLQRSFKMAGVKFVMVSLWQVPDKETVEFMETFYSNLLNEKSIREAFTSAQNEMRRKYDPYYWAAFGIIE